MNKYPSSMGTTCWVMMAQWSLTRLAFGHILLHTGTARCKTSQLRTSVFGDRASGDGVHTCGVIVDTFGPDPKSVQVLKRGGIIAGVSCKRTCAFAFVRAWLGACSSVPG